jgi:hypothetical protein
MNYTVEIVWNREFDFVNYANNVETFKLAKEIGESALDMGDGARVKKYRVLNSGGNVIYPKYTE